MTAAAFNKILSAMTNLEDSPKAGLIPAFRDGKAADANSIAAASANTQHEAGSSKEVDSSSAAAREAMLAAASQAAAPAAVLLNAHRMLALSPTLPQSMQRPQWSSSDYHVLEKLYTGYASKVYKAVCKRSNEVVVLKSYQLSAICELYQHQIFREVGLHASLAHENVVQLSAAFQEGDFVILVQEFAAGGNLLELLQRYGGRLSEHVTVQMVLEPFLRVLQYLHTRGIIHRDIKPENILFSKGMTLKLADFGLAIDLRRERAVTRAGTLDYMAPEVLNCPYKNRPEENKEKAHLHYSGTVDSWAVGVLAYELLVGCPPFYDSTRDRAKVEHRIRNAAPAFPRTMSEDAKSFITSALTKDAAKRPSILQLLHHPWINTYRARRSMRQINLNPGSFAPGGQQGTQDASALPCDACPAAATGETAAKAGNGATNKQQQPPKNFVVATAAHSTSSCSTSSMGVCTPTKAHDMAAAAAAGAAAAAAAAVTAAAPGSPALAAAGSSSCSPRKALPGSPRKILKFADDASECTGMVSAGSPMASSAALSSPKGLSTPQATKPKRSLHHRESSRDEFECEALPMLSAKSSPLMVADMREVQLGPAYAAAAAAAAAVDGAGSSGAAGAGAAAAGKQRRNWLDSIKLWNDK